MANTYTPGDAGDYPTRHNKRELKVIETANTEANDKFGIEVSGTLTSAKLLAMNATPVVVIAAPGAGKAIIVDEVELFLDYATATYAAGAGEDLVLRCTTTTTTIFQTWDDADDIIEGTADTRAFSKPTYGATFDPLTADNESVEFAILSGEWATGDSPIKYRIRYREVTLIT